MTDVLAALDIGTNSFHLVVARTGSSDRFEVIAREKELVRLGSGSADMRTLEPDAIERGIAALGRLGQVAAAHGADLYAVATSAVREADNATEFIRRAREDAGVDVQVISGPEEARLIHLGVLQAVPVFDRRLLLIDIGGGSTEILIGQEGETLSVVSLKVGALRLTQRFFRSNRLHPSAVDSCRRWLQATLAPVARQVRRHGFDVAVGSSGTIATLCAMANARAGHDAPRTFNNFVLDVSELDAVVDDLIDAETLDKRRKLPGLDPSRADIILAGALIAQETLAALDAELADLNEQTAGMKAQWQAEKEAIGAIQARKEELETLRGDVERETDLEKAAEIRYGRIPELERQIEDASVRLAELQAGHPMLQEEVDDEDIAEVVSRWTGVPVSRLMEGEMAKLVRLEDVLHERVVGQHEAVTAVANAIRRSRAGLADPNRPIGSFLFLGPTGVGKTELARSLADFLFDDERAMVRIDMSEYMEKHTVSRLIGAPPGYVGYDEGGQLTEAVRRRPYAVVLLDEVEKAHPDVFNVLLQLLDDGRLTDGQGRTVDFTNTVLIMTSNLPGEPRDFFRPEFINRIDEIVRFAELGEADLRSIVDIQLQSLEARVAARRMTLVVTESARAAIAREGFDPAYGARPLKRVIQRELADRLAVALLEGRYLEGDTITVDLDEHGDFTLA